jgi:2'-5' RNA ligase
MRTFIAIPLPGEIKDSLSRLQGHLKLANADVSWVQRQNIHLTLKFLGEIDEPKANLVKDTLEHIAHTIRPFTIRLLTLGAFPRAASPRIIWVGVDIGEAEVTALAQSIEQALSEKGFIREERPFSSHITLGRVRSGKNRGELTKHIEELNQKFNKEKTEFTVKVITFFKSTLTPNGPVYEPLKEITLTAT